VWDVGEGGVAAAKTMKLTKTKHSAYHKQTSEYTHTHTHTQTQKDDSEIRSPSHANTHQYTPILTHTYIPHVAAAEGTDSFLPLPFVFIYCFFL